MVTPQSKNANPAHHHLEIKTAKRQRAAASQWTLDGTSNNFPNAIHRKRDISTSYMPILSAKTAAFIPCWKIKGFETGVRIWSHNMLCCLGSFYNLQPGDVRGPRKAEQS